MISRSHCSRVVCNIGCKKNVHFPASSLCRFLTAARCKRRSSQLQPTCFKRCIFFFKTPKANCYHFWFVCTFQSFTTAQRVAGECLQTSWRRKSASDQSNHVEISGGAEYTSLPLMTASNHSLTRWGIHIFPLQPVASQVQNGRQITISLSVVM